MWLILKVCYIYRTLIAAAKQALGWPERCELAVHPLWECSYNRLKLAKLLGRLLKKAFSLAGLRQSSRAPLRASEEKNKYIVSGSLI